MKNIKPTFLVEARMHYDSNVSCSIHVSEYFNKFDHDEAQYFYCGDFEQARSLLTGYEKGFEAAKSIYWDDYDNEKSNLSDRADYAVLAKKINGTWHGAMQVRSDEYFYELKGKLNKNDDHAFFFLNSIEALGFVKGLQQAFKICSDCNNDKEKIKDSYIEAMENYQFKTVFAIRGYLRGLKDGIDLATGKIKEAGHE